MKIEAPLAAAILLFLGCSSDNSSTTSASAASSGSSTSAGSGGAGGASSTSSTGTGTAGSSSTGSGGSTGGSGGSGGGRPADVPATDSMADVAAFIQNGGYKMAPWVSDVAAPRAGGLGTVHGDNVRVWLNSTAVSALKAGRDGGPKDGGGSNPTPDQYSMAVKEMYDDAKQQVVGIALSYRSGSSMGLDSWVYYCYAPDFQCLSNKSGSKDMPIYGKGNTGTSQQCGFCHGGTILTPPPR